MLMAIPETKETDELTAAALTYATFGWPVFPCKPKGKDPLISGSFTNASTTPTQIKAWWQQFPNALIGVACGASGIVVLDYDPDKDPDLKGTQLCKEFTEGVETREARSGRGGHHWYFEMPGAEPIHNSSSALGPGVDIRGDGGYVIAPPSVSEFGPYRWLNQTRLSATPHRLRTAIRKLKEESASATASGSAAVMEGRIPEGMRDDHLFRNACAMRRRGMAPLAIEAALLADNAERYDPPLPADQVRAKVQSALRYKPEETHLETPISGKPAATLTAQDSVRVTMSSEGVEAWFAFEQMERTSKSLDAVLTVEVAAHPDDRVRRRINMLSGSAQKDMRLELDNIYGKGFGWAKALNKAFGLAEDTFLKQKRSIALPDIPVSIRSRDVIDTLLPSDGITMLYGLGGVNKSYIGLAMAIASATGGPFAEMYSALPGNVLYVDYEDTESVFRGRAARLCSGSPLPDGIHYYRAGGVALKDQWEALKTVCDEELIHWLIVDSVGPAVAGDLKDATGSLTLTNTLARLNLPGLLIHHVSKDSDGSSAYGSVYFGNAVRRAWHAEALESGDPDDIQVQLKCTKVNEGRRPAPQYLRVVFDGDREGPVRILSRQPTASEVSPHSQLRKALSRGAKTIQQLAAELNVSEFVVRKMLGSSSDFVTSTEPSTGGRPKQVWGIRFMPPTPPEQTPEAPF